MITKRYLIMGMLLLSAPFIATGENLPWSNNDLFSQSAAICRATADNNRVFTKSPNDRIFTATGFTVSEAFKGVFGDTIKVEHHGGELNGRGEVYCDQPTFSVGTTYLLFIGRRDDGTLYCLDIISESDSTYAATLALLRQQADELSGTGEDVSDQTYEFTMAALNFLPGSTGLSSRFLQGDRGEPIEYVVDMDAWPAGITSNQALSAVSNAFAAWSGATKLTFKFDGVESFGMAAPYYAPSDERIYIQLHDNYGYIDPSSTLAVGGRGYSYDTMNWPDGGLGGRVGTNEFDRTTKGYVVVENGKTDLSTLLKFEEVLCHEIGHVLSLGHSSEDINEPDPVLKDATMYYLAHFDGRGASVHDWDTNTIHIVHSFTNTPPYGYDRIIRALSSPPPQAPLSSGVNQTGVDGYDLQGGAFPVLISSTSINGTFALENSNTVFYTPSGYYGDSAESDWDRCYVRMSDGVNLSPPIKVRVIQLLSDGDKNYLPNSWEAAYSVSGDALDDDDGDGFTNLDEWFLDSDPSDYFSNFLMGMSGTGPFWNSRANDLYQLQSTTNLTTGFSNEGNPVLAATTNETAAIEYDSQKFYRVQRLK